MEIREAGEKDLEAILHIFKESISNSCRLDYNEDQIKEWLAGAEDRERWLNKIKEQYFVVAYLEGEPVGFASIEGNYIDFLFVMSEYQNIGVATNLIIHLETIALSNDVKKVFAKASKTALEFFKSNSYEVVQENIVNLRGTEVINYTVEKYL